MLGVCHIYFISFIITIFDEWKDIFYDSPESNHRLVYFFLYISVVYRYNTYHSFVFLQSFPMFMSSIWKERCQDFTCMIVWCASNEQLSVCWICLSDAPSAKNSDFYKISLPSFIATGMLHCWQIIILSYYFMQSIDLLVLMSMSMCIFVKGLLEGLKK